MILVALLLFSFGLHWFQFFLLLIGLGTLGAGLFDARPPNVVAVPTAPSFDLRSQLAELDNLRADGLLKPTEHKRKRAQLIEEWGRPPIV